MKFLSLFLLGIHFLACTSQKQEKPFLKSQIEQYFENLTANRDFAGIVLIGNKEKVLAQYIAGYADLKEEKLHSDQSQFGIASLTKTFTAAAIIKLKEEGKLQLEDKVGLYLPSFPHGDKISILNLLRHEAGLSEIDVPKYGSQKLNSDELIAEIGKLPLQFEPGTNGRYSNAAFSVLAKIIEQISGQSFEQFLKATFFTKLGIEHAGDLRTGGASNLLAKPYFPGPPPTLLEELHDINHSFSFGSGSLFATASDLWKWGQSISQKQFIDVFKEDYPYGWGRDSIAGHFSINQTGLHNGYVSSLFVFPDQDIVIVLLSNIENGLWVDWSKDVAKLFFKDQSKINFPAKREIIKPSIDSTTINNIVGTYRLNADRFVEIRPKNGNLYLHLNAYAVGHYLAPVNENKFELRSFTGTIEFNNDFNQMIWTDPEAWGGSSKTYKK